MSFAGDLRHGAQKAASTVGACRTMRQADHLRSVPCYPAVSDMRSESLLLGRANSTERFSTSPMSNSGSRRAA